MCVERAVGVAQRAAPVHVPRSVARDQNMSAFEQLPFAFALPMQIRIVSHDSSQGPWECVPHAIRFKGQGGGPQSGPNQRAQRR